MVLSSRPVTYAIAALAFEFENWRGRDGNDPSFDIAKDAERRF